MSKLLRVILKLSTAGIAYDIMEYEILKLGHKVCVVKNQTRQQSTRQVPKEDIMQAVDISDQQELSLRLWCHEADLEEGKTALMAKMENRWEQEKVRCEAAMGRVRITGFVLVTETPTVKRQTFEEFIAEAG